MNKLAYTIREAADLTSSGEATIREAINRKELAAKRVGSTYRILHTDLEAWLNALPDAR